MEYLISKTNKQSERVKWTMLAVFICHNVIIDYMVEHDASIAESGSLSKKITINYNH